MVRVFKNGRMMFKHKNKSFSFPETLFIYYFLNFYFFSGEGTLADAPRRRPHGHNCVLGPWPVRAPRVPQSGSAGRIKGWPPLGTFQAAVVP